jgi:hypothetical protein
MPGIGHGDGRLIRGAGWTALGLVATLAPAVALWGFTVDDALISVRYARHLALGLGWRFNAHGAVTDGVTPLPWPIVLAPLARAAPLVVLERAKLLGIAASMVTGGALGRFLGARGQSPPWLRAMVLAVYALSVPVGAYAVSGMETPACTLLATLAAVLVERPALVAGLAGLAATLRPEMAPWAFAMGLGSAVASRRHLGRALGLGLAALLPFLACAMVRLAVFGHVAPLAVMAKPSDLGHGVSYAGAAAVVSLAPVMVVAPRALSRSPPGAALVVAGAVHLVAMAMAGGDWMPFARLVAPVVPSLCVAAIFVAEQGAPRLAGARAGLAMALGIGLDLAFGQVLLDGRKVSSDRARLVEAAQPVLGPMNGIAALDVGWVGAATEGDVVDLAGLTDPLIAALPGGHTSKRVDVMMLLGRDPDGVVLFAPQGLGGQGLPGWAHAEYGRVVEQRLAADPVLARHFEPAAWLPLADGGAGYVVLRALHNRAAVRSAR